MTVFEAGCEDTGKLLRLSVYGEREGYLGVMVPRDGRLYLKKSLSRAALRSFPQQITHAGPAGETAAAARKDAAESKAARPASAAAESAKETAQAAERHGAEPGSDLVWHRDPDGCRTADWKGRSFLAIPMAAHGLPMDKCLEQRPIEGLTYAVFETKDGKII
jgi:hypothetical protein